MRFALLLTAIVAITGASAHADDGATRAIASFNAVCFTAGLTSENAQARMEARDGAPLPYRLTFWDKTLQPAPGTPDLIERRCEVRFQGRHTGEAVAALRRQMAAPPVFGTAIALPATHKAGPSTVLIEGRALLRGRVAVVQVGVDTDETYISVDRLPADWEARL